MMELEELNKDVKDFMDAFFVSSRYGFKLEILEDFPTNCCEFISMLFAKFLIEKKKYTFHDVLMVKGQCKSNNYQLHLWLEVRGVICDLTAGQFDDAPVKVIVTEQSVWHKRFNVLEKKAPQICFKNYINDYDEKVMDHDYLNILSRLI